MDGLGIDALRAHLGAAGVHLSVDGDTLRISGPRGALSPALRQALSDHKPVLLAALTGFRPLDAAIVASETGRRPLDEIERRLARVTKRAASPLASALDKQLLRDWSAILQAKRAALGRKGAADRT